VATRQYEWQQEQHEKGLCIICRQPAEIRPNGDVSFYCEYHHEMRNRRLREKKGKKYTPQTCGVCGEEGHNRRTCPEADAA
jgi:hypothetical protein